MTRPAIPLESITLNCAHEGPGLPGCLICDPRTWPPVRVESAEQVRAGRKLADALAQLAADTQAGP